MAKSYDSLSTFAQPYPLLSNQLNKYGLTAVYWINVLSLFPCMYVCTYIIYIYIWNYDSIYPKFLEFIDFFNSV